MVGGMAENPNFLHTFVEMEGCAEARIDDYALVVALSL